ncbi:MAG TPA: hypothetical protein VGK67_32550 [Myxococcales bacterium]
MSDDSRRGGPKDEAPAGLDEARAARDLAEAMDGKGGAAKPDEEALATAAQIAAARKPDLSADAKARVADDLFGPAVAKQKPSRRWGLAVAASVLVAVGGATFVGGMSKKAAAPDVTHCPNSVADNMERKYGENFHRKAELLIAEMMPQPIAADRAQAIAERARARLQQEAAP